MKTTRFDASDYLDSAERQTAYINVAFETGDAGEIRDALGIVARARGMAAIANAAHLSRESLYKALGDNGNPEFATVLKVLTALGLRLSASPAQRPGKPRSRPRKSQAA